MIALVFIFGLIWGSFLNVVAYRLVFEKSFWAARSACPACKKTINWYDLIPVVSWIILRGKCRSCRKPISVLYPLVELATAGMVTALFLVHTNPLSFFAYTIFASALIVATRTDLQAMVIPQLVSIALAPLGVFFAALGVLDITMVDSMMGAIGGYGILWLIGTFYRLRTGVQGIGEGDMELLCLIGAFLGPVGVWASLMIGSVTGAVIGGLYLYLSGKGRKARIPFGPFLALGAIAALFIY